MAVVSGLWIIRPQRSEAGGEAGRGGVPEAIFTLAMVNARRREEEEMVQEERDRGEAAREGVPAT